MRWRTQSNSVNALPAFSKPSVRWRTRPPVQSRLQKWKRGKELGYLFDNDNDTMKLDECRVYGFDVGDFIEDEGAMSPDDYAANELLKDELNDVLLELTDREEKVLRLRFGLDDGRTRTLEEVGREFNVTRERIRQIEAKALRKLKHPSRSKRLKDFLDR